MKKIGNKFAFYLVQTLYRFLAYCKVETADGSIFPSPSQVFLFYYSATLNRFARDIIHSIKHSSSVAP